ncbi:MAG: ribonuclease HI [Candidatus Sericytochromatia bacterium]|nr:ribonuclease HI [Candidatus Sericytochromatia bacterium]
MNKPNPVTLYSDGCALNNPGPGGWASILVYQGVEKEIVGGEPHSTNNRAEMMAVITGLQALKRPCRVHIVSDSQYVIKGMTEWLPGWVRRGWQNAAGEPVKNRELWEKLAAVVALHEVSWEWVKGHAGHPYNERCDQLAKAHAEVFKLRAAQERS